MQTNESTKNQNERDAAFVAAARRNALTTRIALLGPQTRHHEKSARKEDHPTPHRFDIGNRHAQGAQKRYRTALWLATRSGR